ncbi:MAG: hypothetical protein EBS86_09340, partial [Crocinitomicaceae bacterium]|nr:hypothetical protein [Crocinitomicaceae bacterium]
MKHKKGVCIILSFVFLFIIVIFFYSRQKTEPEPEPESVLKTKTKTKKNKKILHLVLYSEDHGGPYDNMKKITEKYYKR